MKSFRTNVIYCAGAMCFLLFTGAVHRGLAQNTFPSSGNAGVGTLSPEQLFDIYSAGADPYTMLQIRADRSGYGNIRGRIEVYAGGSTTTDKMFFGMDSSTASARMLTLRGDGNVGIGTQSPTFKLHILGTSDNQMKLDNDGSTYTSLYWANNGTIKGQAYYNVSSNQFRLGGSGTNTVTVLTSNTDTERMRIDASGNVGIGTQSPNQKLDINGNANFVNDGGIAWGGATISDFVYGNASSHYVRIYTNGANRLSVDSSGNVGIGTTSPAARIHASAPASGQPGIRSDSSTNNWAIYATNNASAGSSYGVGVAAGGNSSDYAFGVNDRTNALNYFYMRGDGNVGIGTASPTALLHVKGSTTVNQFLESTGANANVSMRFINPTITAGELGIDAGGNGTSGGQFYWYDGGYRFTIQHGTGNVGIGRTDPSYKLDVNGDTRVTGNINLTGTINAKYQDVAEWVESSEKLAAGTVVVLDSSKSNQVISSTQSYDTRVAGVISAQPGITLGEKGDGKVLVATTGRVKVKVDATKSPIQIGDLLVTSDVPGVAMKSEPVEFAGRKMHMPGTLIGKALEPLAKGKGEILVLLSLQ